MNVECVLEGEVTDLSTLPLCVKLITPYSAVVAYTSYEFVTLSLFAVLV